MDGTDKFENTIDFQKLEINLKYSKQKKNSKP